MDDLRIKEIAKGKFYKAYGGLLVEPHSVNVCNTYVPSDSQADSRALNRLRFLGSAELISSDKRLSNGIRPLSREWLSEAVIEPNKAVLGLSYSAQDRKALNYWQVLSVSLVRDLLSLFKWNNGESLSLVNVRGLKVEGRYDLEGVLKGVLITYQIMNGGERWFSYFFSFDESYYVSGLIFPNKCGDYRLSQVGLELGQMISPSSVISFGGSSLSVSLSSLEHTALSGLMEFEHNFIGDVLEQGYFLDFEIYNEDVLDRYEVSKSEVQSWSWDKLVYVLKAYDEGKDLPAYMLELRNKSKLVRLMEVSPDDSDSLERAGLRLRYSTVRAFIEALRDFEGLSEEFFLSKLE